MTAAVLAAALERQLDEPDSVAVLPLPAGIHPAVRRSVLTLIGDAIASVREHRDVRVKTVAGSRFGCGDVELLFVAWEGADEPAIAGEPPR